MFLWYPFFFPPEGKKWKERVRQLTLLSRMWKYTSHTLKEVAYLTFAQFHWPEFNHMATCSCKGGWKVSSPAWKQYALLKIKVERKRERKREWIFGNTKKFPIHCAYVDNRLLLIFKFYLKINIFMAFCGNLFYTLLKYIKLLDTNPHNFINK